MVGPFCSGVLDPLAGIHTTLPFFLVVIVIVIVIVIVNFPHRVEQYAHHGGARP